MELTYHKTLPYSTVIERDRRDDKEYDILYDILIKQTGNIHSDWDGTPLDIEAYKRVVFEPYDLKWIQRSRTGLSKRLPFLKTACAIFH